MPMRIEMQPPREDGRVEITMTETKTRTILVSLDELQSNKASLEQAKADTDAQYTRTIAALDAQIANVQAQIDQAIALGAT